MTFMPPGERIDGTVAVCARLHLLLACFRASPPPMRLPEVSGRPLPDLLASALRKTGRAVCECPDSAQAATGSSRGPRITVALRCTTGPFLCRSGKRSAS
jgi:hypothetical protein